MEEFILDPTTITLINLQAFLLVLFRVAGVVEVLPILGAQNVPRQVKVWLAFFVSVVVFGVVRNTVPLPVMPQSIGIFLFAAWTEFILGIMIGMVGSMLLTGFQVGGRLVSDQLGFSLADIVDPISNQSISITSQMIYMCATLLFLVLGGLGMVLVVLSKSFEIVPPIAFQLNDGVASLLLYRIAPQIFVLGVTFAAPVVIVVLLSTVGLGLVGKVVPEMNIFSFSFGVRVFLGLIMLVLSVKNMPGMLENLTDGTYYYLREMLQLARGNPSG
ncbi:MAG: flagellar biosynthetic protein FliR [Planctomycetes bacterium]|nr:flagellar biosynthetic protein FliR [Planctomycetota bacterium]